MCMHFDQRRSLGPMWIPREQTSIVWAAKALWTPICSLKCNKVICLWEWLLISTLVCLQNQTLNYVACSGIFQPGNFQVSQCSETRAQTNDWYTVLYVSAFWNVFLDFMCRVSSCCISASRANHPRHGHCRINLEACHMLGITASFPIHKHSDSTASLSCASNNDQNKSKVTSCDKM